METYPLSFPDKIRFKDAAKFWAWRHNKTVRTRSYPDYQGDTPMWRVRVTLLAHHRKKDLPTL